MAWHKSELVNGTGADEDCKKARRMKEVKKLILTILYYRKLENIVTVMRPKNLMKTRLIPATAMTV